MKSVPCYIGIQPRYIYVCMLFSELFNAGASRYSSRLLKLHNFVKITQEFRVRARFSIEINDSFILTAAVYGARVLQPNLTLH